MQTIERLPANDMPSAASTAVFSLVDQALWIPRSAVSGWPWMYSVISVEGVPG